MADRQRAARSLTLGLLLVFATVACGKTPLTPSSTPTPTPSPRPSTNTPPQIPPVANSSSATIEAVDPFAIVHRAGSWFGYGVRFLLRETGGRSGATITRIVVYGPSGSDETGPGCWQTPLRVPPLGTLDTFHTDEGANWLLYCGPGSGGTTASPSLYVIVTFADDVGSSGSIGFPIASFR